MVCIVYEFLLFFLLCEITVAPKGDLMMKNEMMQTALLWH